MGSIGRVDSMSGREMAMNEENPNTHIDTMGKMP